jgi:hypothetical protein
MQRDILVKAIKKYPSQIFVPYSPKSKFREKKREIVKGISENSFLWIQFDKFKKFFSRCIEIYDLSQQAQSKNLFSDAKCEILSRLCGR